MARFSSRKMEATKQNYFMVKWNKHHVELWGERTFYEYCVFYSGRGKEFTWYYLGLTVSSISLKFFEISSQGLYTFNFHQNKNIFTKQIIFLSNLLFSLIKVLQYKMILKTYSISINNERHNKRTVYIQLNFNFLTNNVKGLRSSKKRFKIFEYFRNKVAPKGILFLLETHSSVETEKQ